MSKFTDTVTQETPRLVVKFKCEDGKEMFDWGVVGHIPLMSLIGAIVDVQTEITLEKWMEKCPEQALVIVWNELSHTFSYFVSDGIPVPPLVGMLEVIKTIIVATMLQQMETQRPKILAANGMPFRS